MTFKDKVILITGATTGIGRATAIAFAQQGGRVFANYLREDEHALSLQTVGADFHHPINLVQGNVTQKLSVQNMVSSVLEQAGRIDVLVNNSGLSMVKPMLEISEEEWDLLINTDLKSVFLCSQAVLPAMQNTGSGVIINIASELGFTGRAKFSAYCAAKGGVITLTRAMAQEFAPNIRINGVAPGPTETPLLEKENATPGHEEDLSEIPLGRYARAEEIADSILFMASEQARYFCGEIISPNGGTFMR